MQNDLTHRQKRRQRSLGANTEELSELELTELLLTYAIPRRPTEPIARALLKRFGSLEGVLSAERGDLLALPGVMPEAVDLIKLSDRIRLNYADGVNSPNEPTQEDEPRTQESPAQLASVRSAAEYCRSMLSGRTEECVLEVLLGEGSRVISSFFAAVGDGKSVSLPVDLICANALREGVRGVVIAHNHPSGSPRPSMQDIELTRSLARTLDERGVRLYEHFIIGGGACFALLSDAEL